MKLEELKKIIVDAVPEVEEREIAIYKVLEPYFITLDGRDSSAEQDAMTEISTELNNINLEDVLMVEKSFTIKKVVNNYNVVLIICCNKDISWQLGKSLDNQSPETIDFLLDLLK